MRIISIVGGKNTGKTTLSVKIIKELKKRNFKVNSVKHSHHGMTIDHKGKDTYQHKEAGAEIVVGQGTGTFFNINEELDLDRILFTLNFMNNPDFVVIEGFKTSNYAKITTSTDLKDEFTIENVNAFDINEENISELVDKIEAHSYGILDTLTSNNCKITESHNVAKSIINNEIDINRVGSPDVFLSVNEKVISLNPFVNDFMKYSILGMLKSLKIKEYGVDKLENIDICIKKS